MRKVGHLVTFWSSIAAIAIAGYPLPCSSQVAPPTISGGIEGIVYNRGKLDADLIVEIIGTKQEEIKQELMNRIVLNKLECGSFAGWNFARKSLDALFKERSSNTITKELLKNITELGIVVGIAEVYLKVLTERSRTGKLTKEEQKFLLQYFRFVDDSTRKRLPYYFLPNTSSKWQEDNFGKFKTNPRLKGDNADYNAALAYYTTRKQNPGSETKQANNILNGSAYTQKDSVSRDKLFTKDPSFRGTSSQKETDDLYYLPRLELLRDLQNKGPRFTESRNKRLIRRLPELDPKSWELGIYNAKLKCFCDHINPNQIFIDQVYDVIRRNEYVRDLGLFHNLGVDEQTYQSINKSILIDQRPSAEYKVIRQELELLVDIIFKYYYVLHDQYERNGTQHQINWNKVKPDYEVIDRLRDKVVKYSRAIIVDDDFRKRGDFQSIQLLLTRTNKLEQPVIDSLTQFDNLYFFTKNEIQPLIQILTVVNQHKLDSVTKACDQLVSALTEAALWKLTLASQKLDLRDHLLEFVHLLNVVYHVDDVNSYDVLAKFLANFHEVYGDRSSSAVMSAFAPAFDKYITINEERNTLDFDAQSFAVNIYDRFGANNSNRFQFYFSVGMNYGFPIKPDELLPKSDSAGRVDNVSLVSEKVGLKLKLIDWNRRYTYGSSRNPKSFSNYEIRRQARKPVVSDWFFLMYGSGLLYQIEALKEPNTFTKPIYGFSTGLCFFNGLDLTLGYAVPFGNSFNNGFYNVGFDVKFIEYLGQLKKKK